MFLCVRIDLDYVPWDSPDAKEFGHGEPALLLRLLDLARHEGYRFQFFVSNRTIRAFPSAVDAVLGEGHDLDWLCKHPEHAEPRLKEARLLLQGLGASIGGMALKEPWPDHVPPPDRLPALSWISTFGPSPLPDLTVYPVALRPLREAVAGGMSVREWSEAAREAMDLGEPLTIPVRPQVLAKLDPRLSHLRDILKAADERGLPVRTLRQDWEARQWR